MSLASALAGRRQRGRCPAGAGPRSGRDAAAANWPPSAAPASWAGVDALGVVSNRRRVRRVRARRVRQESALVHVGPRLRQAGSVSRLSWRWGFACSHKLFPPISHEKWYCPASAQDPSSPRTIISFLSQKSRFWQHNERALRITINFRNQFLF